MAPDGARAWLYADEYDAMCMDFNSTTTMSFRTKGDRSSFEVYNNLKTGTYNALVPQLPDGEVTVAEAYPYNFYICCRHQDVDTRVLLNDSTHTVHFYPENVLREFTFMIYDVVGAENMVKNGGAMTGMSGSFFPATGELASTPSTILFSRVEGIPNAQVNSRWTEEDKKLFAARNPNWASSDTLVGWTRDWVVGKFVTFGPLSTSKHRFRLTVETSNQADSRVYASWGYWHGQWEDTVVEQIAGAMGTNGTKEEQMEWRKKNGGYDIVLYNDHRFTVPRGEKPSGEGEGGFQVGVGGWGDPINVPTAGSNTRAASLSTRSIEYTDANLPDFTVNGVHTLGSNKAMMFNAQYVYKTESRDGIEGRWAYTPAKYWYSEGTVDFYAYAPAGVKNLTNGLNDDGTNVPVIEYTMPYIQHDNSELPPPGTGEPNEEPRVVAVNQEDLLVSVENKVMPLAPDDLKVTMNFHHAFSRIDVMAMFTSNNPSNRCKVVRVDLCDVYSKGELTLSPSSITSSGYSPSDATLWSSLDNLASYRFQLATNAVDVTGDYTSLIRTDDMILVMPQQVEAGKNAASVYVEYDVYIYSNGKNIYKETCTKKLALPIGHKFSIGRQYRLLLPLDYVDVQY